MDARLINGNLQQPQNWISPKESVAWSLLCPLTSLHCCWADKNFSCVLIFYQAFLDTATLSAGFFLFFLSGQPGSFLKAVLFNSCADSDQNKSNLKDTHLLKRQQRVFEEPDSDKDV